MNINLIALLIVILAAFSIYVLIMQLKYKNKIREQSLSLTHLYLRNKFIAQLLRNLMIAQSSESSKEKDSICFEIISSISDYFSLQGIILWQPNSQKPSYYYGHNHNLYSYNRPLQKSVERCIREREAAIMERLENSNHVVDKASISQRDLKCTLYLIGISHKSKKHNRKNKHILVFVGDRDLGLQRGEIDVLSGAISFILINLNSEMNKSNMLLQETNVDART